MASKQEICKPTRPVQNENPSGKRCWLLGVTASSAPTEILATCKNLGNRNRKLQAENLSGLLRHRQDYGLLRLEAQWAN